jgi:hypothetical protein
MVLDHFTGMAIGLAIFPGRRVFQIKAIAGWPMTIAEDDKKAGVCTQNAE